MESIVKKCDKEDKIFKEFFREKENFKQIINCIVLKLNDVYKQKVSIDDFSDNEIFNLFLCHKKEMLFNEINFFKQLLDYRLLIINFAISLLTVIVSLNLFNKELIINIGALVIVLIIVYIAVIIISFVFWKLLFRNIIKDKCEINEQNILLSNIDLINQIIDFKYCKKIKENS